MHEQMHLIDIALLLRETHCTLSLCYPFKGCLKPEPLSPSNEAVLVVSLQKRSVQREQVPTLPEARYIALLVLRRIVVGWKKAR